jgi:hypothetical protein
MSCPNSLTTSISCCLGRLIRQSLGFPIRLLRMKSYCSMKKECSSGSCTFGLGERRSGVPFRVWEPWVGFGFICCRGVMARCTGAGSWWKWGCGADPCAIRWEVADRLAVWGSSSRNRRRLLRFAPWSATCSDCTSCGRRS